jgi:hypothetical protein
MMQKDYPGAVSDLTKIIELDPQDTTSIKNKQILLGLIEKPN